MAIGSAFCAPVSGAPNRSGARAAAEATLVAALGEGEGEDVRQPQELNAEHESSAKAVRRQDIEREYSPAAAPDYSVEAATAAVPGSVKRAPKVPPRYWSMAPPATFWAVGGSGLKSKP